MKCPNCGIHITATSKFCKHCGIEISEYRKQTKQKEYTANTYTSYPKAANRNNRWIGWVIFIIIIFGLSLLGSNSNKQNATPPAGESNPPPPNCSSPTGDQVFNSLSNGYEINRISSYFNGNGELQITNGTEDDAVVKIIYTSTNTSIGEFYIDANNSYTLTGINDGNYNLFFSLGKNWDSTNNKFITCKSFTKFDDQFNFVTTDTQYTSFNVTLNPITGGTAQTTSVDESEFEKY